MTRLQPGADISPTVNAGQPHLTRALAVLAVHALASVLGLLTLQQLPHVHAFAPAAGVSLAVLLRWGNAYLPALAVSAFGVSWLSGTSPALALAMSAGHVAGPWLAAHWLRQAGMGNALESRRDVWQWLGAGVIGGTLVDAGNAAAWSALAGDIGPLELPRAAALGWMADALGVLLAGLPMLVVRRRHLADALSPERRVRTIGTVLVCAAAVLMPALAPANLRAPWLAAMALPPVLLCWLALRDRLPIASLAVMVIGSARLMVATSGLGPFAHFDGVVAWLPLWCWLLMLSSVALLAHVHLAEPLREAQRWRLAVQASDLGVAEWNLADGTGHLSPRWCSLTGEPEAATAPPFAAWLDRLHPDDATAVWADVAALRPPVAVLRRELRLRRGRDWHWFALRLSVAEFDDQGAPRRLVATLADFGERRQAADREQLSSNVFMHLQEGLLIVDAGLRVLDANPAYCHITGIPRDDLLGTVPDLLRARMADGGGRPAVDALWTALEHQTPWVGEVSAQRSDGDQRVLHVTASPVREPEGGLRYHVIVVSDITEQRRQRERLERQAHFDELTRLPNRARLAQLMADAMQSTERDNHLLVVCSLDIDRFKDINERHGHAAGDRLLAEVANRMRSALRGRGTDWADTAARLGGDEFVLLLRATTLDDARGAVERVLRLVGQPFALAAGAAPEVVTASVGATVYPLDASDADTLLRHADHAMYGAKQAGRKGYQFFDPEISRRTEERVLAIGRVQDALDHDELELYYQPKVDLKRGTVLGLEALLRWNHPERGLLAPAQFLPLIEHTGLSSAVGDHVLSRALDQLDRWHAQGLDLSVSVNITARHLQEPDFALRLAELLARHTRPLGPKLELEVLETAALADITFTSALLERCARLGVRWALDDFGTGYSTLTYLKRLPVQVLKIDRSFVHNMLADAQDRAIVDGVISLARTFDCVAVAEGVETAAQARMLLDMGCEVGQGTGISPPMPAKDVAEWVRHWKGLFALSAAPPVTGAGTATVEPAPPDLPNTKGTGTHSTPAAD